MGCCFRRCSLEEKNGARSGSLGRGSGSNPAPLTLPGQVEPEIWKKHHAWGRRGPGGDRKATWSRPAGPKSPRLQNTMSNLKKRGYLCCQRPGLCKKLLHSFFPAVKNAGISGRLAGFSDMDTNFFQQKQTRWRTKRTFPVRACWKGQGTL